MRKFTCLRMSVTPKPIRCEPRRWPFWLPCSGTPGRSRSDWRKSEALLAGQDLKPAEYALDILANGRPMGRHNATRVKLAHGVHLDRESGRVNQPHPVMVGLIPEQKPGPVVVRIDLICKTHGLGHDCAEAVGRVKNMLSLIEKPHRLRLIE